MRVNPSKLVGDTEWPRGRTVEPPLLEAGQFDLKAEIFKAESRIGGSASALAFSSHLFFSSFFFFLDGFCEKRGLKKAAKKPD